MTNEKVYNTISSYSEALESHALLYSRIKDKDYMRNLNNLRTSMRKLGLSDAAMEELLDDAEGAMFEFNKHVETMLGQAKVKLTRYLASLKPVSKEKK